MTTIPASHFAKRLEPVAQRLGITEFSRGEAQEWAEAQDNAPSVDLSDLLQKVISQWEKVNPSEYGDPFGILTFWEDQRQAQWDAQCFHDSARGYSRLMRNLR
jgi:hypothetical protein